MILENLGATRNIKEKNKWLRELKTCEVKRWNYWVNIDTVHHKFCKWYLVITNNLAKPQGNR